MKFEELSKEIAIMLKPIRNKNDLYNFMKACLHYVHTFFDIPDADVLLRGINGNDACKKLTSLITAERLYSMHSGKTDPSPTFKSNFERKDEFRSLSSWQTTTSGYISRLVGNLMGSNKKDVFGFLGYIQKLGDDVIDTFNGRDQGVKSYIKNKIGEIRGKPGFTDPPVASLINNVCVMIQVDTEEDEPIRTDNFSEEMSIDYSLSQSAVVLANIYNDIDTDMTNQEPNNEDEQTRGGRRKTRRKGGWVKGEIWKYQTHGSIVVFPKK
jgi:hypothetical protein